MQPETVQAKQDEIAGLVRVLGKVLAGDFSERLELTEDDDDHGLLVLLLRFVIDDLEALQHGQASLQAARSDVDRSKRGFLRAATQEMHTPLTPIRMQLHMLRQDGEKGDLSPRQARGVEIIERNLTRLLVIMQELIDLCSVDGADGPLECEPFDVPELVLARLEEFGEMARSRNIQLASEVQPGLIASIDVPRMAQVIDGLLSNALKNTPDGGFVIVRCRRRDHEILVEVQDSGAGIEPEQAKDLFRPFSGGVRSLQGDLQSGLGLFACRQAIERHGGLIWATSDGLNQGSTFSFVLPLRAGGGTVRAVRFGGT